jgi:hypothetical protein
VGGITQQQFDEWIGVWPGGYVDGWGYVGPETVIYGSTTGNSDAYGYSGYGWQPYGGDDPFYDPFYPNQGNPPSGASNNVPFNFTGGSYGFWEGGGVNAIFSVNGNIFHEGDDSIRISASMSGAYVSQSNRTGAIRLKVNGTIIETKQLTLLPNGYIHSPESYPLGETTFDLSGYSGKVELEFVGGYNFYTGSEYAGNGTTETIYSIAR